METDGCVVSAPNSRKNTYVQTPAFAVTQPSATEIDLQAVSVSFAGLPPVNYSARTFTIPTPPDNGLAYYITIADPNQQGESSPTLTATCQASDALAGIAGNTYVGGIVAFSDPTKAQPLPGGWPPPQGYLVGP